MDFFNSRTFEIFRYVIPSSIAIFFSIWLFRYDENIQLFKEDFIDIDFLTGLLIVIILYVIGIFIDELVYRIFRFTKKIRGISIRSYKSNSPMSISEKYSVLRMESKENFTYIEYWNALKGMCRNLAVVGIYIIVCTVVSSIIFGFSISSLIIICIMPMFSYLMFLRAALYSDFAQSELDSSIDVLKNKSAQNTAPPSTG